MSESLYQRFLGPALANFEPNTVLKATALNEEFERLRWEATLRATAPNAPGLFRPWWCDETVNRIALTKSFRQVEISLLFLMTRDGRPIHVRSAKVSLNKGQSLYLTPGGGSDAGPTVDAGSTVPEDAILIAQKVDRSTLTIKAEIAVIDATPEIAASHSKAIETTDVWKKALFAQPPGAMDSLANAFASVVRRGAGTEAASALDRFAEAADSIVRYLVRRDVHDSWAINILTTPQNLTTPPESLEASTVEKWLEVWSRVLGDKALQAHVLSGEADWLSPVFKARGTELDGIREHRFDVSHLGKTELELYSSGALERARWRFGESGKRHLFDKIDARQDGGWRTFLPAATAEKLVVWTNSDTVRLRAIRNPGAAR